MTDQPLNLDAEYRDDSLDLLHVDPAPDTDATPCHWTDCPLDAGHDDPHAELAKLVRWHREDETALKKMRATIERLRAELATARNPHTPRLCRCGHSHHAHTVPAPHSCFAYGHTCPCEAYRQLPHDEAMAQLERNRRAAAERERAAAEETHVVTDDSDNPEPTDRCGARHHQHPDTVCTEPAGHYRPTVDPHAGPLILGGRECGGAAWDDPAAVSAASRP